jgi:hypothetical protein
LKNIFGYFFPLNPFPRFFGCEKRLGMGLRKPVPGANLLADVASENPSFRFIIEFRGDAIFQFNG